MASLNHYPYEVNAETFGHAAFLTQQNTQFLAVANWLFCEGFHPNGWQVTMEQSRTMKDAEKDSADRGRTNKVGVSGTALGKHRSAPKWIELLPAGDFAGRDGRGPFRLSNPAAVDRGYK